MWQSVYPLMFSLCCPHRAMAVLISMSINCAHSGVLLRKAVTLCFKQRTGWESGVIPAIPCALNKEWGGVLESSPQVGHFSGLGSWCVSEILLLMVQQFAQHKK